MTKTTVQLPKTCAECGTPFTPNEWIWRHYEHDGDCRHYLAEHDWHIPSCSCDLPVHGRCCETCNPPAPALVPLEAASKALRPAGLKAQPRRLRACAFCSNRAAWRYPSGWLVCSSCRPVADGDLWEELAGRWLRNYPKEWVGDVADFIEMHLAHEGGLAEPFSGTEEDET